MSLQEVIESNRKAIEADAVNAHAVFAAQGTLVGVWGAIIAPMASGLQFSG